MEINLSAGDDATCDEQIEHLYICIYIFEYSNTHVYLNIWLYLDDKWEGASLVVEATYWWNGFDAKKCECTYCSV